MKPSRGERAFHSSLGHLSSKPSRSERVAKLLREEISLLMVREMKDPRVRMASVSEVRLSPDLKSARVKVSALGDEKERHLVIAALRHAEGFIRSQLGDRLENLNTAPRLHFELDESIAYSVHISSVLREIGPQDGTGPEPGAPPATEPE